MRYLFLAAFPVPDNPTDCGDPAALSKIIRVAVCSVALGGEKVTETLHFLPGLSVFSHADFTVNTGGSALSLSTFTATPVFFLPLFLIVTLLALLVVPIFVLLPKQRTGLDSQRPKIGVGVAVGVAVAVGVTVAVPVAVAVAVGDGVAEGGGGWRPTNTGSASSVYGPLIVRVGESWTVPVLLPSGG